jgi:hypothetical protein
MELSKNEKEPIYDEKVKNVIRLLTEGITKEEIAKQLGYTTYRSLDVYLNRKNFQWDSHSQNYTPKVNRLLGITLEDSIAATSKVAQVIALFNKEEADAKIIAKRLGFSDHRELASYMSGKGYQWHTEKRNYAKIVGLIAETEASGKKDAEDIDIIEKYSENPIGVTEKVRNSSTESNDLQQFLPLLIMLQKNKDRLVDLIMPQNDSGTIPRYALPGVFVTKSVHMVSPLDTMVRDFSREKNVSQRDIVATALLEYFRKYGYEREVEQLLGGK